MTIRKQLELATDMAKRGELRSKIVRETGLVLTRLTRSRNG